ncbi:MAG: polyphosphate kinase 1 [Candidatus Rokuibacteriota bacterium]|nr:MAG: polyphosphate kinase 1 [Candidatus Rokubacteria bacterium]
MNSDAFVNRELSWLEFNRRVLEEAQDPSVPLLERVKFLAIFSSNLDEFFMIRVAALKRRIAAGDQAAGPDGMSSTETLSAVAARVHELVDEQHRCFLEEIQPLLAAEGIFLLRPKEASDEQQRFLEDYFRRMLLPVLTPLAVDPGHPFPYLGNRSLCLVASIRAAVPSVLPHSTLSVIHIPSQVLPRFVPLPDAPGKHSFMLLEDVIRLHLPTIYNGYEIVSSHAIRVTRDAYLQPRGGREDLLVSIEESLRERRLGTAVRLQHDGDLPPDILATLLEELELSPEDLFEGEGFAAFSDLFQLYTAVDAPRLKDRSLPPHPVPAFETAADMWSAIRASDVLVHHPYHTFDAVTRFVVEAATDPKVLAIKMTLYRVSPASPIAHALRTAVENGKEVAVLVELQARFDEEANIRWARALEEVGAHVVYGLAGFKTHCKACLVVRQEADGIRRYCHLATGNYNVRTATTYEDLGLFTSRESFGEDLTELFNLLTGYTRPHKFHHLLLAPRDLREGLIERIRRESEHARGGRPARIIAKMNGLLDRRLIEELYEASQAGVSIDLIVRGMCALRPEVPGLSDNIRCISIVDRFLEHARIFYFANAGTEEYLLASADWMPRNLDRRVEITFPILDPALQTQVRTVLDVQLADTVKARRILPDGSSVRLQVDGGLGLRSQERLYEITGAGGVVPAASVLVDGGREID